MDPVYLLRLLAWCFVGLLTVEAGVFMTLAHFQTLVRLLCCLVEPQ